MRGGYTDQHSCGCRHGRSETDLVCRHVTEDEPCSVSAKTMLELDGVFKRYGDETSVSDISLSVREGELVTIVGPSGCGKTTTLRLIAGLERPTKGSIRLDGEPVAGDRFVPPERRNVGLVFQEFALFPHMTVRENVGFGIHDWEREEREQRVDSLLSLVELESKGDARPEDLSGGQRQRVALARALAPEPDVVLLDEPFSNLDVDLRVRMREEIRSILKRAGVTAISVTHDQEEALSISDRVAVMHDGTLEQLGHPETVFQRPKSRFVAEFLGDASFLSGRVVGDRVETPAASIPREHIHGLDPSYERVDVDVLVRPDDIIAIPTEEQQTNGRVSYRRYLGPSVLYRIELDNGDVVRCQHNHAERIDLGMRVRVELQADHELAWFPAESAMTQSIEESDCSSQTKPMTGETTAARVESPVVSDD